MSKGDPPPQIANVHEAIKKSIQNKDFRFSTHANTRGVERSISFKDALYVLKNGFHNEKKTSFNFRRRSWKYAIDGKTLDGVEARVIVAFQSGMVIITIIKLVNKKLRRKQ